MQTHQRLSTYLIGEGSLLIQCGQILLVHGHEVCGVISEAPAIKAWARKAGVPCESPYGDTLRFLHRQPFDVLFSIANMRMIPAAALSLARKLAINFHDALLPRYAGAYATTWALCNEERTHGVTWHEMTAEPDKGRILKQASFEISTGETALSLNTKCWQAGIETFRGLLADLAGNAVQFATQDLTLRTYHGLFKRPAAAGAISWEHSAAEIEAFVRALDFGSAYENPLCLPKLIGGDGSALVVELAPTQDESTLAPGTVVRIGEDGITVATSTDDVAIKKLARSCGSPLGPAEFVAAHNLRVGDRLLAAGADFAARLSRLHQSVARHESFWVRRLRRLHPLDLPHAERRGTSGSGTIATSRFAVAPREVESLSRMSAAARPADLVIAALALYLARASNQSWVDLAYRDSELSASLAGVEQYFACHLPWSFHIGSDFDCRQALERGVRTTVTTREKGTYLRDVAARYPELHRKQLVPAVVAEVSNAPEELRLLPSSELTFVVREDGSEVIWHYDESVYPPKSIATMQGHFRTFLGELCRDPARPLAAASLLSKDERRKVLFDWNDTAAEIDEGTCMHHLFEEQVRRTPNAEALVFEDLKLSYRDLNERANRLAHYLRRLGVGPDTLVGICTERDADLVISTLAVLKAGGAYVPLDPNYPRERLEFMVADSQIGVLVTQEHLLPFLGQSVAHVVCVDRDATQIEREAARDLETPVAPSNLAYVIYTSGSTGKPKGVMVEHRNAVNFFHGMDPVIPSDPPGTWLAVTSFSFDISVLEIFWTLARGFRVALYAGEDRAAAAVGNSNGDLSSQPIDFSVFYFSSDEGTGGAEKYRLLIEGAKFADRHGFTAVWTPERHFHAFGGLYPNPAVTSAAIATITERVKIRSGSCVVVLHSPIRVAEEWALVDNLSNGRVGISFAAGWQPNDFVLAPENFADRKNAMFRNIATVQRLWSGEAVPFKDGTGKDIEIRTLPRPVQKKLPTWITAAGNPETFQQAGALGANILTHLLGQGLDELAEKVAVYRRAWREAGHEGEGCVTLMLHTFVGKNDDEVRETVRQPMKDYLRSSISLIQKAAWSFPTFKQSTTSADGGFTTKNLTGEELEAVLDFSFERYFETSSLFGTPETCMKMVNELKTLGINEIACLIDFGVAADEVLASLPLLDKVRAMANAAPRARTRARGKARTIPDLIARHGVTHMQCTPSMAVMLLGNEESRAALGKVQYLYVGGEALPLALADQLRATVRGFVTNMYGPTETTVWSTTSQLGATGTPVTIGRPIANTRIYLLDREMQAVPIGVAGELCIGGAGVVRGYLHRPELTQERFREDPVAREPGARIYRTGDLARYREDGEIEFLGRSDHQVKIRGYRIELGEIEAALLKHPSLRDAVVIAREDVPGDKRLVAYYIIAAGRAHADGGELREFLKDVLPEFMVPAAFLEMDSFPLTPNLKIDRKSLPAPDHARARGGDAQTFAPPGSELERKIAQIWQEVLKTPEVGIDDNFFDLGGHSLLTVQVHGRLKDTIEAKLTLVDLFQFPTIRSLVNHINSSGEADGAMQEKVESRVKQRLDARGRRSELARRRRGS